MFRNREKLIRYTAIVLVVGLVLSVLAAVASVLS